ncbi:MAG: hypothetical protein WB679_12360, partial [Terracidiphilus sp.]
MEEIFVWIETEGLVGELDSKLPFDEFEKFTAVISSDAKIALELHLWLNSFVLPETLALPDKIDNFFEIRMVTTHALLPDTTGLARMFSPR